MSNKALTSETAIECGHCHRTLLPHQAIPLFIHPDDTVGLGCPGCHEIVATGQMTNYQLSGQGRPWATPQIRLAGVDSQSTATVSA